MRVVSLLACAAIAFAASTARGQKAEDVPRVAPNASAPRGEVLQFTSAEGQPFWYRLPKKADAKRPPNLVFMLHGTGLPCGWAFWNYPIATGQFRGGDIVVAPEGLTPGEGGTFNFVQGKQDGDQIAGLIQTFRKEFEIGKVYVYGHSQGAFFAYWFAGDYTELVDGIVAHAGNVLDVDHNKLAKSKVAIGILHGKADAVVPVECAYRTEQIYKEQGYQKLRLHVVEGLTEQSGHWPLPDQVAEMFEWLDQVSTDTPGGSLAAAFSELAKGAPNLAVVVQSAERAAAALKKHTGDDKAALTERLALLQQWLAALETAASSSVTEAIGAAKPDVFGPWMAEFRAWHEAFAASPTWQKSMKSQIALRDKHDKAAAKAVRGLTQAGNAKTLAEALEAIEESPLAGDVEMLTTLATRQLEAPPKGFDPELGARYREIAATRAPLDAQGRKRALDLLAVRAGELKSAHPELFAE